jgi:hypothetical protein
MIHKSEEFAQRVRVRVVRRSGSAALVEWLDNESLRRATVPLSQIEFDDPKMGTVDEEILEMGIPYGLPWEEIIGEIKITPSIIANTLRQHGIWTLEDIEGNSSKIVGALQAAYGLDMATLIRGAHDMRKEKHHD